MELAWEVQRGENDSVAVQCKEHQGNLPRLSSAPPALLLSPAGHIHTHGCREAHQASRIIEDSACDTGITAPAKHLGQPVCPTAKATGIHGASTVRPATSPDSECSHSKPPAPFAIGLFPTILTSAKTTGFNKDTPRENRMSQVQILSARPEPLKTLGFQGFIFSVENNPHTNACKRRPIGQ